MECSTVEAFHVNFDILLWTLALKSEHWLGLYQHRFGMKQFSQYIRVWTRQMRFSFSSSFEFIFTTFLGDRCWVAYWAIRELCLAPFGLWHPSSSSDYVNLVGRIFHAMDLLLLVLRASPLSPHRMSASILSYEAFFSFCALLTSWHASRVRAGRHSRDGWWNAKSQHPPWIIQSTSISTNS